MDPAAAKKLLNKKLAEHGLKARGWTGHLDSALRRFGVCYHTKKRISLSRHLVALNSDEETLDTILHEIAHALAGPEAGHGLQWRTVASRIGADPKGVYDAEEVASVAGSFFLVHGETGEVFNSYHRRPQGKDLAQGWIGGRREETLGKLKIVTARELAHLQGGGKDADPAAIQAFDAANVRELRNEIMEALTAVGARHGLLVEAEGGRFTSGNFECSFGFRVPHEHVVEGDRAEFALHAHLFGLTAEDFGKTFTSSRGESFVLAGLKPRNSKYPIIGKDVAGQRYKFPSEVLKGLR